MSSPCFLLLKTGQDPTACTAKERCRREGKDRVSGIRKTKKKTCRKPEATGSEFRPNHKGCVPFLLPHIGMGYGRKVWGKRRWNRVWKPKSRGYSCPTSYLALHRKNGLQPICHKFWKASAVHGMLRQQVHLPTRLSCSISGEWEMCRCSRVRRHVVFRNTGYSTVDFPNNRNSHWINSPTIPIGTRIPAANMLSKFYKVSEDFKNSSQHAYIKMSQRNTTYNTCISIDLQNTWHQMIWNLKSYSCT